jgi:hypothetical protein
MALEWPTETDQDKHSRRQKMRRIPCLPDRYGRTPGALPHRFGTGTVRSIPRPSVSAR